MHPVGIEVLDRAHDLLAARGRAAHNDRVARRIDPDAVGVRQEASDEFKNGGSGGILERHHRDTEAGLFAASVDDAGAQGRGRDAIAGRRRRHRQPLHGEHALEGRQQLGAALRCRR